MSPTISPPPLRVRSEMAWRVWASRNFVTGTPATVHIEITGTIESPWPPRTIAWTSSIETFAASAMNMRNRAESSAPAMPTTRSRGKPVSFLSA